MPDFLNHDPLLKSHPYAIAVHIPTGNTNVHHGYEGQDVYVKRFEQEAARNNEKLFIMGIIEQGKGIALNGFTMMNSSTAKDPYCAPGLARKLLILSVDPFVLEQQHIDDILS